MKKLTYLTVCLALVGCGDKPQQDSTLLHHVNEIQFNNTMMVEGELKAKNETVITGHGRGPKTIAWLAPENSFVKKGDIVARFDGASMQRERVATAIDKAKSAQDLSSKKVELTTQEVQLNEDLASISKEKNIAQTFSVADDRIWSQLELFQRTQDLQYLTAQERYFEWQKAQFSGSALGEVELIELQNKQHRVKISELDEQLNALEVTAPHDGLLTYEANWMGEKPKAGQIIFGAQKLAAIPDTSVIEATLFIHEKEAIGLQVGLPVELKTLSDSTHIHLATISAISPMPKTIRRGDPQKYYEITASFEQQHAALRPGLKVTAAIIASKDTTKLAIPKHTLFNENGQFYVFAKRQGELTKVQVTLGSSNASHAEVIEGLNIGDQIALNTKELM